MSVRVITRNSTGKPKRYLFTDTIKNDFCACHSEQGSSQPIDDDISLSDQARERMLQRNRDAWKK